MATTEERVTALETEFRTERRHLATKANLGELENRLTWRFLGVLIALTALVVGASKYLPGGTS